MVRASYPGADAETVATTVATPLEQEINGVEDMLYMSSYSTADGSMTLTITFELGTDLDAAQVLVQNRVAIAEPRLPDEVRRLGVTTTKSSPDLMMVVHHAVARRQLRPALRLELCAARIRDMLIRLDGVGDIVLFGEREYSRARLARSRPAVRLRADRWRCRRRNPRAERPGFGRHAGAPPRTCSTPISK